MRMHRGSSKETAGTPPASEALPLSASPPMLHVTVDLVRGGKSERRQFELPDGTVVRDAVRAAGGVPEASAAMIAGRSVPLDRPLRDGDLLEVVRTFSGG